MSTVEVPLNDTLHINLWVTCTNIEEADEKTFFMGLSQEIKFLLR